MTLTEALNLLLTRKNKYKWLFFNGERNYPDRRYNILSQWNVNINNFFAYCQYNVSQYKCEYIKSLKTQQSAQEDGLFPR